MKKLLLILVGLMVVCLPMSAFAGVAGSDHDLTGGGSQLCFACHTPHNASGDKLWASTPSGTFSGVQDLCYTCHDGGIAQAGLTTVFDANKEQHTSVGDDCSGAGACHDVHTQLPNLTGKFLVVTETNGSYCETCHDGTPFSGAGGLGDHTAGITHFTNGGTFTCNQCHTPHGATAQTTNPPGLTNPILLADNQTGTHYGTFCISCHSGTPPTEAVTGSGGVASSDPFDYSESTNDGTETKHPTTSSGGDFSVSGCNMCHEVHDPSGTATGYLLPVDNTLSVYCATCHDGVTALDFGANTHFTGVPSNVNMNAGLNPALPWADQLDDDGTPGADWSGAVANYMICETCHSVHRKGNQGLEAAYFLRWENGATNQLCTACHSAN